MNERASSMRLLRDRPRAAELRDQDDEGSKVIKDKLRSMWNNMKYGKWS